MALPGCLCRTNFTVSPTFEDPVPFSYPGSQASLKGNYGSNLACVFTRNRVIPRLMQAICLRIITRR